MSSTPKQYEGEVLRLMTEPWPKREKPERAYLHCKRFPEVCPTLYLIGANSCASGIIGLGRRCYNFLYFVSSLIRHTQVSPQKKTPNTPLDSVFPYADNSTDLPLDSLHYIVCIQTQANGKNCIECVRINTKTRRCITFLSVCSLHTFFSFSNMTWGETESSASTITVLSWTLASIDLTPTKKSRT